MDESDISNPQALPSSTALVALPAYPSSKSEHSNLVISFFIHLYTFSIGFRSREEGGQSNPLIPWFSLHKRAAPNFRPFRGLPLHTRLVLAHSGWREEGFIHFNVFKEYIETRGGKIEVVISLTRRCTRSKGESSYVPSVNARLRRQRPWTKGWNK